MSDVSPPDERDGADAATPPERPRYGELAPPGWEPPRSEAPPAAPPAPSQPGLIPLRPLSLADILAAAFGLIRRAPGATVGFALAIAAAANLLALGVVALTLSAALSGVEAGAPLDPDAVRGIIAPIGLAAVGAAVVQLALLAAPQAVVTLAVARTSIGERGRLRALWPDARGRVGALAGWAIAFGGSIVIVAVAAVLGLAELAITGGDAGAMTAVGLGLLVAMILGAGVLWLGTRFAFVASLIVVERRPIGAALRRSWAMTRGSFWRILGISVLANLIIQVGAQLLTFPVSAATSALAQTPVTNALDGRVLAVLAIAILVQIIVTGVAVVIQAAVPALLYLDTRIRREAFDAELRAAAARVSGTGEPSPDPFR